MNTQGQRSNSLAEAAVEAPPDTVLELLKDMAAKHSEAPAIPAPGRPPLSYGGLLQQALKTVEDLRALGVNRNDRVAIVLPNGPEMAASFLTVAAAATCAPLNPAYRANEFEFYLTDTRAKALVIAAGAESPARDVASALGIPTIDLHVSQTSAAGTFDLQRDRTVAVSNTGGTAARLGL